MKKRIFTKLMMVLSMALVSFAWGCNDEDVDFDTPKAELSSYFLNYEVDGTPIDGGYIDINSNREWTITTDADWVRFSQTSGNGNARVRVSVLDNPGDERSTLVTIMAKINPEYLTVTQKGASSNLFNETFGTKDVGDKPKVGAYDGYDNYGVVTFSDPNGTADIRTMSNQTPHLWLPANKNSALKIEGIDLTGATNMILTFKFAANLYDDGSAINQNVLKVTFDGVDYPLTSKELSKANGDSNQFYEVSIELAGTGTAASELIFAGEGTTNTAGLRIDDIKISGITNGEPVPTVLSAIPANITTDGATVGGSFIIPDGISQPTEVGVEYWKDSASNTKTTTRATTVENPFSIILTGLAQEAYSVRAYAIIDGSIVYGTVKGFTPGGGSVTPGGEFFNETFGTLTAGSDGKYTAVKINEYTGYDMTSQGYTYFDSFAGTYQNGDVRTTTTLAGDAHVWFPAYTTIEKPAGLLISGIPTGKTNMVLSYDITANGDGQTADVIKVKCNGTLVTVPATAIATKNTFVNISFDIPDGTTTIEFVSDAANTVGFRVDNVKISGDNGGSTTFGFNQATFSGTLTENAAASGTKIQIPYTNATGSESYPSVSVAVVGAGAGSLAATVTNPVTLTAGNGTLEFTVTGTPSAAGDVTFTINGIDALTAPKNAVTVSVLSAGSTPSGQIFAETFGTADVSAKPKVGAYTGYDNQGVLTFSDPTGTNADLRKTAATTPHIWFPANKNAAIQVGGINADGKTNMVLTFDVAANLYNPGEETNQNVIKVTFDGVDYTLPSKVLSNANGDNNVFYPVSVNITATGTASSTLTISTTASTNTLGMRVDNIVLSGDGGSVSQPLAFSAATFSGTLTENAAASGTKIQVPYTNATGSESYPSVSVAVTGAGAGTLAATATNPVTLTAGNGTLEFTVTGTPSAAGDVTFTVNGIAELTAPNNAATATVASAGGTTDPVLPAGVYYLETFGTGEYLSGNRPAVSAFTDWDMKSATYTDSNGKCTIRSVGAPNTLNANLWIPATVTTGTPVDNSTVFKIDGITPKTNVKLSYDIMANKAATADVIGVKCNGAPVAVPSTALPQGSVATDYITIEIAIPDGTTSIEFVSGTNNTFGFRLDNIKVSDNDGVAPITMEFGQATYNGLAMTATSAVTAGAKIQVPYTNAAGTESYSAVAINVTGAGAGTLAATVTNPVALTAGNGTLEFEVSGTPSAAGDVVFTISGITELAAPKNAVTVSVAAAPSGGEVEYFFEDFGSGNKAKIAAYTAWTMGSPIAYADQYGNADVRTTGTLDNHIWFPSGKDSELAITGIPAGYKDITLTYKTTGTTKNANSSIIVIMCNGVANAEQPTKTIAEVNTFEEVTLSIPDGTTSLSFVASSATNTNGFRIDDIKLVGTPN